MDLNSYGTHVSEKDSLKLLRDINKLLNNENSTKFPGYQPVSFMKCHIQSLLTMDYLVCEKSDGIRALLYVLHIENTSYGFFLDRKNLFYRLDLSLPQVGNCLFDGEFVVDSEDKKDVNHYVINDVLILNDENVTRKSLLERLSAGLKFLNLYAGITQQKFQLKISVKKMFKSYGMELVNQEKKLLKHKSDGLIFTPVNVAYKSGTSPLLLKWKPPELNSVDFIIKRHPDFESLYELFSVDNSNGLIFFDFFYNFDDETEKYGDIDGKLGEFSFDRSKVVYDIIDLSSSNGGWVFMKLRTDKDTPNSASVAINVLRSINEDISLNALEEFLPKIRNEWKSRESRRQR